MKAKKKFIGELFSFRKRENHLAYARRFLNLCDLKTAILKHSEKRKK